MTSIARKALVIVALSAISLSSCALGSGPISGQVVDESTGKPVFASSWSCSRARASSKNEYRLWKSMAEEAAALAESPEEESRASMLRKFAEQSLVNFGKPTHIVGSHYDNIDPDDRLRIEELWP
jgi:hypothetical protein